MLRECIAFSLPVCLSVCSSACLCLFVHPSLRLSARTSVCSPVCPSVRPPVYMYVRPADRLTDRPTVSPSILHTVLAGKTKQTKDKKNNRKKNNNTRVVTCTAKVEDRCSLNSMIIVFYMAYTVFECAQEQLYHWRTAIKKWVWSGNTTTTNCWPTQGTEEPQDIYRTNTSERE